MARARNRKNPQRRKRDCKMKKLLQAHCALLEQQNAQVDGTGEDSAGPAATALPSDKDAPGPETASTADQKASSSEPKHRCKHRKLPDRHYYRRPDKMERQYLGLQRRVTSVVDEKIAQGSTALEQWKRDAGAFMAKFKRKAEEEQEEMRRDLRRLRELNNLRHQAHSNRISHLSNRLREVQERYAEERYAEERYAEERYAESSN